MHTQNCVRLFILLCGVILPLHRAFAQNDSLKSEQGTIRGTVISVSTKQPIIHARVSLKNTKMGAISNEAGEYRISNVNVGRYVIVASCLGYSSTEQEVLVSSAHQSIMQFELLESAIQGDSITISANRSLDPINRAAILSATPFTIQDVNRYAAAFQDPSRMAENFAGVYGRGTTNNYIVVRGGSPIELLWLLDGIEIANPNHFGKSGSSGGLISAINSSMLGNSDFLTGAFPAQYGTRLSAVFDLHTRDGNTEQIEGTAQLSFNGMEGLIEGPIPALDGSSFLLSFRHSTLGFLREIGLLDYDNLPDFDDAMAKLHFKLSDKDQLNFTGLWGDATLNAARTSGEEIGKGSGLLVAGLNYQHILSDEVIVHLLVNHTGNSFDEGLSAGTESVKLLSNTLKADISYTPNLSSTIEAGISAARTEFDVHTPLTYYMYLDTGFISNIYQEYLNWNWHIVPELTLNTGLYHQSLSYTGKDSYEPRASMAWSPTPEHQFAIAYGVHRQAEPLEFAAATHIVAGYTFRPWDDVLLKLEAYQKKYSQVPIHEHERDNYSFLNAGYADRISFVDLINIGKGKSYGAEFTMMKHYGSGYYITATASYIRQEFAGSDNITHWGTFDNKFIFNFLSGYDIELSNSSVLTVSEKFTIAGGGTYTPFDAAASDSLGRQVLDESKAFSARNPSYVRLDLNAEFHFNWRKTSLTIYASVLNALDIQNIVYRRYDFKGGEEYEYDLPIIPIIGIRFEF